MKEGHGRMQIVIDGCFSHDGQGTCEAKPTSGGHLNFLGRFFVAVREFVEDKYICIYIEINNQSL